MTTTRSLCALLRRVFRRRPPEHVGATERFGAELRAMRTAEVSPELVSDVERELQWGLRWHEFEHAMQGEIDRVFAPYLAQLADVEDFDEVRELVFPEALHEDTKEWKLVGVK